MEEFVMKFCKKCGAVIEFDHGDQLCDKCHKETKNEIICKHCGTYVNSNAEICPKCGCYIDGRDIGNKSNTFQPYTSTSELSDLPDYKQILMFKFIVCVLLAILGIVITISSINISAYEASDTADNNDYYDSVAYAEFGTDYYTYMYKALRTTSENTEKTAQKVARATEKIDQLTQMVPKFKIIGVGFGLFMVLLAAYIAVKSVSTYKKNVYQVTHFNVLISTLNKSQNK